MKNSVIHFPDRESLEDYYNKIMDSESHYDFIIKKRYHKKTNQYSLLFIKKTSTANNNKLLNEDEIDMIPKRDLVDDVNDRIDYKFKNNLKSDLYRENITYARWDKNIYCDICGKYQTRKEFELYQMCKKCYSK